jgi:hypothetical protein
MEITVVAQVLDPTDEEPRHDSGLRQGATERLRDAMEEAGFEILDIVKVEER